MLNDSWKQFDRVVKHIDTCEPGTDEFDRALEEMKTLVELQYQISQRPDFESRLDKLMKNQALVAGIISLVGTVLVLNHERFNVITSRAFSRP